MYNKQLFEFHDIPELKKMVVIILELKKKASLTIIHVPAEPKAIFLLLRNFHERTHVNKISEP